MTGGVAEPADLLRQGAFREALGTQLLGGQPRVHNARTPRNDGGIAACSGWTQPCLVATNTTAGGKLFQILSDFQTRWNLARSLSLKNFRPFGTSGLEE
jgi:hypothetical protein